MGCCYQYISIYINISVIVDKTIAHLVSPSEQEFLKKQQLEFQKLIFDNTLIRRFRTKFPSHNDSATVILQRRMTNHMETFQERRNINC